MKKTALRKKRILKHKLVSPIKSRRASFRRKQRRQTSQVNLSQYKNKFAPHPAALYTVEPEVTTPSASIEQSTSPSIRNLIQRGVVVIVALLFIMSMASAGSLTPSATPSSTGYTLSDIYTRLTTNATTSEGNHGFSIASSPSGTLRTLIEIFNAIPTIDATKVTSGTAYLGITGTYNTANLTTSTVATSTIFGVGLRGALFGDTSSSLVCASATYAGNISITSSSLIASSTACGTTGGIFLNLFNGTITNFPGGTRANGGADDYNNGGSAPTDRYTKSWTACAAGNNYCGTGLTSADAKDDSTGIIWSLPCNGAGCDTFSDSSPMSYAWASSTTNANNFSTAQSATSTATGLCTNGDHAETGWFLPHQKQLLQAYIDGSYGNLEAVLIEQVYWTATTASRSTTAAHVSSLSSLGNASGAATLLKTSGSAKVRCVR